MGGAGGMYWEKGEMHMGERRYAYRIFVGKVRRPLGRPRHRWKDNIAIDFQEIRWGGRRLDSSGSGDGQVAGSCKHHNEPSGSTKCGELLDWLLKTDSIPWSWSVSSVGV